MKIFNLHKDFHIGDNDGQTLLLSVLSNRSISVKIIKELLKRGLSCSVSDNRRNTPLHIAIKGNQSLRVIKLILEHGIDVNARNDQDLTPIFCAYRLDDNVDVIRALFNHGASVVVKDNDGRTPLHYLIEHGNNFEMVKEFLRQGADINAMDNHGKRPLSELLNNTNNLIEYATELVICYGGILHDGFYARLSYTWAWFNNKFAVAKSAAIEPPDGVLCASCEEESIQFFIN